MTLTIEKLERNWKKITIIPVFFLFFYIFFLTLAMIFYPGGYSYWGYYFSDLGTLRAINGDNNIISLIFFILANLSLMIVGITINLVFRIIFKEEELGKKKVKTAFILNILTYILLIFVLYYTKDTEPELHEVFAMISVLCSFSGIILNNYLIPETNKKYKKNVIGGKIYLIILFTYGFLPIFYPPILTIIPSYRTITQKLVFFCIVFYLSSYILFIMDYLKNKNLQNKNLK